MSDATHFPLERRRHPRTHLQMTLQGIRLDPDGGELVDSLRMVDISRNGMGVVAEKTFYPGQRIVLCLPLSSTCGRRSIYATITRCKQGEEGYRIGLEFDTSSVNAWCGLETAAAA